MRTRRGIRTPNLPTLNRTPLPLGHPGGCRRRLVRPAVSCVPSAGFEPAPSTSSTSCLCRWATRVGAPPGGGAVSAASGGFEPPTSRFRAGCAAGLHQLASAGPAGVADPAGPAPGARVRCPDGIREWLRGVEPRSPPWRGGALPLCYSHVMRSRRSGRGGCREPVDAPAGMCPLAAVRRECGCRRGAADRLGCGWSPRCDLLRRGPGRIRTADPRSAEPVRYRCATSPEGMGTPFRRPCPWS